MYNDVNRLFDLLLVVWKVVAFQGGYWVFWVVPVAETLVINPGYVSPPTQYTSVLEMLYIPWPDKTKNGHSVRKSSTLVHTIIVMTCKKGCNQGSVNIPNLNTNTTNYSGKVNVIDHSDTQHSQSCSLKP